MQQESRITFAASRLELVLFRLAFVSTYFCLASRGQADLFDFIEFHVLQIDLFVHGVSVIAGRLQLLVLRLVCQGPMRGVSSTWANSIAAAAVQHVAPHTRPTGWQLRPAGGRAIAIRPVVVALPAPQSQHTCPRRRASGQPQCAPSRDTQGARHPAAAIRCEGREDDGHGAQHRRRCENAKAHMGTRVH